MDFRVTMRTLRGRGLAILALSAIAAGGAVAGETRTFSGRVTEPDGTGLVGAMVTIAIGKPAHVTTVFTGDAGGFVTPPIAAAGPPRIRVRRLGWKDLRLDDGSEVSTEHPLVLERETDPALLAAQLPANHWYDLVLQRIEEPDQREELKRQCTYCHQQGSRGTRLIRDEEEWRKLLALMSRMGGMLSPDLRERLPDLFNAAYDPATAVPALMATMNRPGFMAPPSPEIRRAIIEEWELGGRASMQHDMMVHPDGRIYSVDMTQDRLYRLDPSVPGGERRSWAIPPGDLPIGGVFASAGTPTTPNSNARVGPHSLQAAPDGSIWITLALGNQLARFDIEAETWAIHEVESGFYPHTLRFDQRGRVWFSLAASNHLGMFDPATGEQRELRLPAGSFGQAVVSRLMPMLLWLGRHVDLRGAAAEGEGMNMPVPYGVDIAADGAVWFSQLNEHRIGRVDPDDFELEMIDTPFPAPRRLRFDSRGRLWIPSFSGSLIARFDPATRRFDTWELPIEPLGSETPYALHVDRRTDEVWICGTNSDSLIRFEPAEERFTVYPLPTRVTYTRELDFDPEGRVWTSNSNVPTWQIEGGLPKILRLSPDGYVDGADRAVARARRSVDAYASRPGADQ